MPATSSIKPLDLDFDNIKNGLKEYLRNRPELKDYDFEGSTIALILDILAYNTYQNNFYTSMVANEMFLDSAQLRENVISRAKMLGYTPRSVRGSSTTLTLQVTPSDTNSVSVTIPKNTAFKGKINNKKYNFVIPNEVLIFRDVDGNFIDTSIDLVQGTPLTFEYQVDETNAQRFIIPNDFVDETSIVVTVRESFSDTNVTTYVRANDVFDINPNSTVFYLQEIEGERYEVIFGDNVLGKRPSAGNVVKIEYRVCNGSETNGINVFIPPNNIDGNQFSYSVNARTDGGKDIETIESIKFSAPRNYETQNRCVVEEDFKNIILRNFSFVESVRVFGGEKGDPPIYGKVFISAKPQIGFLLGSRQKDLINQKIRELGVISIQPEFIDPKFIYIKPTIEVFYESSKTNLTAGEIQTEVGNGVVTYETENLGSFRNDTFRYSRFVDAIDSVDSSILNNRTSIEIEKRFVPNLSNKTKYSIDFGNPLKTVRVDGSSSITSTSFLSQNRTCTLENTPEGVVQAVFFESGVKNILEEVGTVDFSTGVLTLNAFLPQSFTGEEIKISASPRFNDIEANKFEILLLSDTQITVTDVTTGAVESSVTVDTRGSATEVVESGIGTVI